MSSHPAPRSAPSLEIAAVKDDAGFAALENDWNALAARAKPASVFLSHSWFDAAWEWRRLDSELDLRVVRRHGDLVGVMATVSGKRNTPAARRLQLLTVPDTQLTDAIAASADVDAVAEALAESFAHRGDWDVMELNYLLPDGVILQRLQPALRDRGLRTVEQDGGRNTFIGLSGSWADYYGTRSRRLKKANNLATNRLRKTGEVRVDCVRADTADTSQVTAAIDAAIAISAESWKRETGNSLDNPGPQAFIRRLSRHALAKGWFSLWILRVDGTPVAMEYQLIDNGNVHALRSDFDRQREEVSPGSYLFRHLLESSFAGGLVRYYMGPGDNAYKLRWTDEGEPLRRLIVYNRTLRGRAAWIREAVVKPAARRLRARLAKARAPARQEGAAESHDND